MRPTRLVMNAFGPYQEKIDLDFTVFGSSSLFLVTGPTGSGKTTIFDALTYALFNEASGDSRELDMLKSQFATDEDFCFVKLTFDIGTTQYTVKRSPKQIGPGTRVKTRELPANVEFYKGEELLATGRDANDAITQLIGLTYQQFRQIVMLPQGEFRRLLQSNSRDKEEIFRNIFGTEEIEQFQEELKERRKKYKQDFKTYENRLEQSLSSINTDNNKILQEAVSTSDYEQVLTLLDDLIESGNKELTAARQNIKFLSQNEQAHETLIKQLKEQKELEQANKKLVEEEPAIKNLEESLTLYKQAQQIKVAFETYDKIDKEVKDTQTELEESQSEKENLETNIKKLTQKNKETKVATDNLDSVRKEVTQLEKERDKFAELKQKETAVTDYEKDLTTIKKQIRDFEQVEKDIKQKIKEYRSNLENIQMWREALAVEQEQQKTLQAEQRTLTEQMAILEKIIKLQADLADLLQENKQATAAYNKARENYEQAQQHYFGNLAGILAVELEDEQPCPVCGSTHHPQPATKETSAITEEALSEYESIRDEKKAKHTKLSARISQKGELIKEQEVLLTDYDEDYTVALKKLKTKNEQITMTFQESEKVSQELEEKIAQEDTWRKALDKLQKEQQEMEIKRTQEKSHQENLLEQINALEKDIQAIKEQQQFETVKAVEDEIEEKQDEIIKVQKEAEAVQQELADAKNKKTQMDTSIKMLNTQLKKNKEEKNEQEKKYQKLLDETAFDKPFTDYILKDKTKEKYEGQIKAHYDEKMYNTRQLEQVQKTLKDVDSNLTIAEIKEELNELQAEKMEFEHARDKLIAEVSKHEHSFKEIKANYTESQKIHKPLAIYEELAEIANGSTRTNYISFERYVLSIYFDEVLFAANQRFETMTNSRYELRRRKERTKGQSPEGLEIDVFDRYVGDTRSVKTLSGGETFKAALALALGLSDVIQSQQGGVHVDTLFVDEGFGTLDADSLEMAIETLMELQSTGRLIGVISHVSELKNRIPARIVVENIQEGSQARIEVE